jgi:hypothetical protein
MTRDQALKEAERCLMYVANASVMHMGAVGATLALAKAEAAKGLIELAKELDKQ